MPVSDEKSTIPVLVLSMPRPCCARLPRMLVLVPATALSKTTAGVTPTEATAAPIARSTSPAAPTVPTVNALTSADLTIRPVASSSTKLAAPGPSPASVTLISPVYWSTTVPLGAPAVRAMPLIRPLAIARLAVVATTYASPLTSRHRPYDGDTFPDVAASLALQSMSAKAIYALPVGQMTAS